MGLALNDLVQVVYSYRATSTSDRFLTVLHYRVADPDATSTVIDDLNSIVDWFSDSTTVGRPAHRLRNCLAANVFLDWVQAQRVRPARTVFRRGQIDELGGLEGNTPTFNVALSLTKRTNVPGRKGIGRIQLLGIPAENIQDGQIVGDPYKATVEQFATAVLGTVPVTNELILHACLPNNPVTEASDVETWEIQPTVRTMHRRTVGLGI